MSFSFGFRFSPWFRVFLILVLLWEVALFDHLAISFSPVAHDLHRRPGRRGGSLPRASHDSAVERNAEETGSAAVRSVKRIAMPTPKKIWQVWKTISRLEEILLEHNRHGIGNDNDNDNDAPLGGDPTFPLYPASSELVTQVVSILKTLAAQHEGKPEWQGLLNKSTLLHEVEESIVAIHFLQQELRSKQTQASSACSPPPRDVVLVDVCCGKGVFSLLSSYVFSSSSLSQSSQPRIRKIIMLDKDPKLRWDHIHASNNLEGATSQQQQQRPFIECWPRFNLHEIDDVVDRLTKEVEGKNDAEAETSLAMVGIHLCKTLSPACIGIANLLGPQRCPHFILAPCCLPRVVVQSRYDHSRAATSSTRTRVLEVRQYETPTEKKERHLAKQRRNAAMVRGRGGRPNTLDTTKNPPPTGACWKCGELGHVKADCPSHQSTGKPQLIKPPSVSLSVTGILDTDRPFGSYCDLLSTSIQRGRISVEETGLTNRHTIRKKPKPPNPTNNQKDPNNKDPNTDSNPQLANNWNRERKSIYIVASGEKVTVPNST